MKKEKQEEQEVKLPKPTLIEDLGMMFHTEKSKQRRGFGIYKCGFCGTEFKTMLHNVKRGTTKSCGCYTKKHGLKNTRLYSIWCNMKKRTLNPKNKYYINYGGRGITICEEWLDVQNFYNWAMENAYSDELSLDRIDNDGNYEPNNCRWTTRIIQGRNRRIRKDNKTGYKGVRYIKDRNKYIVTITLNKKRINLGSFKTPVEGAIVYNNYIIENSLEGFILNEIPERLE